MSALSARLTASSIMLFSLGTQAQDAARVIDLECDHLPPMCNQLGEPQEGMMIEIGSEALRRAGFVPNVKIRPWKRAMQEVTGSASALMVYFARTPERETLFRWIAVTNTTDFGFITRDGSPPLDSLDQATAAGLIGIRAGSSVRAWLLRQGIKTEQLAESPLEEMAKMLKAGRVASFFGAASTFRPIYQRQTGTSPVVGARMYSDQNWIASGPSFPREDAAKIADAISRMKQDGFISQIISRYFP
ncbi:transporter substrate-binding domain-containing protein [Aquitalea sp.]|uniref:substrate-binding periplasmic protein n=1 Tax=Aquitalea sp. TaxID=1872623 RepID=UPI00258386B2|nr:transporter substrate-binding domain-containing protein [Aquitalea sp.]